MIELNATQFAVYTYYVNNGFDFLGCTVTLDASGGAQYGSVMLLLYDARYPQATAIGALS